MTLKRSHDSSQQSEGTDLKIDENVFESGFIEDRASKFVGLFSSDIAAKSLQAYQPYKSAMHRMLAWRKPSSQQSLSNLKASGGASKVIYSTGSDEDGEKYAGRKLEKLLVDLDVVGAIVVARWYGGVLLGPVRFNHIENVAREAVMKWRNSKGIAPSPKRVKVDPSPKLTPEQEAEQKSRLVKLLTNRDSSIVVLRELLNEKGVLSGSSGSAINTDTKPTQPARQPSATPDYPSMPLNKLLQLEKARDNTIAWILKQIDEAEAKLASTVDSSKEANAADYSGKLADHQIGQVQ